MLNRYRYSHKKDECIVNKGNKGTNDKDKTGTIRSWMAFCLVLILMVQSTMVVMAGDYVDKLYLEYGGKVYRYSQRLVSIEIDSLPMVVGDMPAVLVNDKTMVPVREVFESDAIGAVVNWNNDTQEVYITYLDKFIVLKIDSQTAYVNGVAHDLGVPAMLIRDVSKEYSKTMIPLRFVSESLGFLVDWDDESFTALVYTSKDKHPDYQDQTPEDTDDNKDNSGNSGSDNNNGDDASSTDDNTSDGSSSEDGQDTITDATVISNEQLDRLEAEAAARALPTALANNPIVMTPAEEVDLDDAIKDSYSESDIEREDHEKVYLDYIDFIEKEDYLGYEIDTTGAMSYVDTHVWDGKFIIQIYNCELDLNHHIFEYDDHPFLTAIRLGDHVDEETGEPYAKIVFDLKTSGYKFNLHLDEERDKLYIDAVNNSIYEVELGQNDIGDYIDITGVNAANVETFRLSFPNRIVFDMPNTKTLLGFQESEAQGQYVTTIRTAQFESTTSRIVVETEGQPDYQIIEIDETTTRIQLLEPTYANLAYDNTKENPIITIDESNSLELNGITYTDNYLEHEYIVTIPGDQTSHFGSGDFKVNDNVIERINVQLNDEGNTEIVIQTNDLHIFRVEESAEGRIIKAYKPWELYDKVLVIDPGHGGKDPGATVGSVHEADVNLGVVQQLELLLRDRQDMKVYYTRLDDTYPTLQERCVLANEVEADVFISIHCNSFVSSYTGTETLYLPGTDTPGLNAFEMAEIFQQTFTANTAIESYKMKERDNLFVLKYTDMPAIILEMGYLSNSYDRSYLADYNYHDELAMGIYLSIEETFNQYPTGR